MQIRLDILRRARMETRSFLQSFWYEPDSSTETVAHALTVLNEREDLQDIHGSAAGPVKWECNCLQKKCGACAMVINGRPGLACKVLLAGCGDVVRLEPLKKFEPIEDLIVDRRVLYENLKTVRAWLEHDAEIQENVLETVYEASRCLQCGCCLEVCPNFLPGGTFTGMASAVPMARLLVGLSAAENKQTAALYRKHIYNGCGKSLACQAVCPTGIAADRLLVKSNAAAVWGALLKLFRKGDAEI